MCPHLRLREFHYTFHCKKKTKKNLLPSIHFCPHFDSLDALVLEKIHQSATRATVRLLNKKKPFMSDSGTIKTPK